MKFEDGEYYADGGCFDNGSPEAEAYGSVLFPDGNIEEQYFEDLETNNEAEYAIQIWLLENMPADIKATIYLDSKLVLNQIKGIFRVKARNLRMMNRKLKKLIKEHPHVEYKWVSGDKMKRVLGH